MECNDREVSILLTDDREIRELNTTYRHKQKATDVLTFRLLEGGGPKLPHAPLGDVVISVTTAKRQAKEYGVSLQSELLRLLIHGLLHLVGYEHEGVSQKVARRMRRMEQKLWLEIS